MLIQISSLLCSLSLSDTISLRWLSQTADTRVQSLRVYVWLGVVNVVRLVDASFANCVDCFVEWQAKQDVYSGQVFGAASVCWLYLNRWLFEALSTNTLAIWRRRRRKEWNACTHFEKPYDSLRQCSTQFIRNRRYTENRLVSSNRTILHGTTQ